MKEHSLTQKYTVKLLEEIKTGIYAGANILPPETEIANYFSISRTIIRDCLSILDREGFVSRKRGIGTIINRHVLSVAVRMDLEMEFMDIIRQAGYTPHADFIGWQIIPATDKIASKLKLQKNDKVFATYRTVYADDSPAIYCEDYIPEKLIRASNYDEELLKKPIFDFMNICCNQEVYMDMSEIYAICANDNIAKIMKVETGTCLLNLNEVGYSFTGQAVLYSNEFYRQDKLIQTILRKKI